MKAAREGGRRQHAGAARRGRPHNGRGRQSRGGLVCHSVPSEETNRLDQIAQVQYSRINSASVCFLTFKPKLDN